MTRRHGIQEASRPIESVVVCCCPTDLHFLRICLASIRFWYPDIRIRLLKDESRARFSTREMELACGAERFDSKRPGAGWGLTKLDVWFGNTERLLLLDSDTVFLGPVLDQLKQRNEDFLVTGVCADESDYRIARDYVHTQRIRDEFDTNYMYPGFGFNTGHVVVTRGLLDECDFANVVTFSDDSCTAIAPAGLFPYADQGILNYVLAKCSAAKRCSVGYLDYWHWSGDAEVAQLDLEQLQQRNGVPRVLHWAGTKKHFLSKMHRADILRFFEQTYYQKLSLGRSRRLLHHSQRLGRLIVQKAIRRMKQ